MQPPKKDIYLLQLPIMQLPNKPRAPTTTILDINHPRIFWRGYGIKIQKWILPKRVPTPLVLPKLHHVPKTNLKACFIFESLPTTFDCLPHPHFIPLSHFFSTQPPFFLPVLTYNYSFPKKIPFTHRSPRPFSQKSLVKDGNIFEAQAPFCYSK